MDNTTLSKKMTVAQYKSYLIKVIVQTFNKYALNKVSTNSGNDLIFGEDNISARLRSLDSRLSALEGNND